MAELAIVLTGGHSSRMGRDKAALTRDGRSQLDRTLAACSACSVIVVAGPKPPGNPAPGPDEARDSSGSDDGSSRPATVPAQVRQVSEDPPFGGPVAGIAAAVDALSSASDSDRVLVLAVDLVDPQGAVALLTGAADGPDGVCLIDAEGFRQGLAARYRVGSLRSALAAVNQVRHCSVRRLIAPLALANVSAGDLADDVDTPDQARRRGFDALPATAKRPSA